MFRPVWRSVASCRNCRRSRDGMHTMDIKPLPIMLFNERKLTPSFGYVFDPRWLDPHESIVSILWKLMRMNRLSGHLVTTQLAKASSIDPYDGIAACRSEVDIRSLHQALRLPLKIVREALVPDALGSFCSPYFRYCRKCMCRGYHGVMFQLESFKTCPVHHTLLEVECEACGARTPYRLNANLLDAPYRCACCRNFYASKSPAILNKRPLGKRARIAITRSRLGLCSYF